MLPVHGLPEHGSQLFSELGLVPQLVGLDDEPQLFVVVGEPLDAAVGVLLDAVVGGQLVAVVGGLLDAVVGGQLVAVVGGQLVAVVVNKQAALVAFVAGAVAVHTLVAAAEGLEDEVAHWDREL